MKTIKIRLKNEGAKFWNPGSAGFIRGGETAEVPDVPFWHRRILDGTFEKVDGGDVPNAAPIREQFEADEQRHLTGPLRPRTKKKGKGDAAKADTSKTADDTSKADDDGDELFEATQAEDPPVEDLTVPRSFFDKGKGE